MKIFLSFVGVPKVTGNYFIAQMILLGSPTSDGYEAAVKTMWNFLIH
jgi:hypothetical protein